MKKQALIAHLVVISLVVIPHFTVVLFPISFVEIQFTKPVA
jgi:hypothetical protein